MQINEQNNIKLHRCKSENLMFGRAKFAYMLPMLLFANLCGQTDILGITMALPNIQEEYNISKSLTSWMAMTYTLA